MAFDLAMRKLISCKISPMPVVFMYKRNMKEEYEIRYEIQRLLQTLKMYTVHSLLTQICKFPYIRLDGAHLWPAM